MARTQDLLCGCVQIISSIPFAAAKHNKINVSGRREILYDSGEAIMRPETTREDGTDPVPSFTRSGFDRVRIEFLIHGY